MLCGNHPALLALPPEELEQETRDDMTGVAGEVVVEAYPPFDGDISGSPLGIAAAAGRVGQIRRLLDAGADPDEGDRALRSVLCFICGLHRVMFLMTPLALARYFGHSEAAALLEAAGADRARADAILTDWFFRDIAAD